MRPPRRILALAAVCATVLSTSACGSDDADTTQPVAAVAQPEAGGEAEPAAPEKFPDILKVELSRAVAGYDVAVTVSSPYDSPQRYADGWRVLAADTGKVLGTHTLGHDHAGEQPFTRTQFGLRIPAGVQRVTVEGHDQASGYGGKTVTVAVPR